MRPVAWLSLLLVWLSLVAPARAEDGYELWLRYRPVEAQAADAYRAATRALLPGGDSATIRAATAELERGLGGLTGRTPEVVSTLQPGVVLYGTPAASPPGANGKGGLNWYLPSMISVSGKFTPAACTSISTSFFFGSGLGRSSSTRVSAGPKALHSRAFIKVIPLAGCLAV